MKRIILTRAEGGKFKGQYMYALKGDNGENLGSSEYIHNYGDIKQTIEKYFGEWKLIDETGHKTETQTNSGITS